jgi:hypothetical protein
MIVEVAGQMISVLEDGGHLDLLVESCVLDGHTGGQGQGFDKGQVVFGELGPSDLLGQIEIAVDSRRAP